MKNLSLSPWPTAAARKSANQLCNNCSPSGVEAPPSANFKKHRTERNRSTPLQTLWYLWSSLFLPFQAPLGGWILAVGLPFPFPFPFPSRLRTPFPNWAIIQKFCYQKCSKSALEGPPPFRDFFFMRASRLSSAWLPRAFPSLLYKPKPAGRKLSISCDRGSAWRVPFPTGTPIKRN